MNILLTIPQGPLFDSFVYPKTVERLKKMGNLILNENNRDFTKEEYCEKVRGVDMIIAGWGTPCLDADVVECADKLKYFVHTGGTVAPYVCKEVYDKGIIVMSGNELYAEGVAEGVVAYILASLRRIPYFSGELAKKNWLGSDIYGRRIHRTLLGKTVGIVSYGTISKYLIPMLQPFRVKINLYSRKTMDPEWCKKYNVTQMGLDEVFENSDIITMQTAKNPHTINMITAKQLSKIKDNALFLNTSRGPIVNEEDLIAAIKEDRFDVVLDVYNQEPIPADSELFGHDENVLLFPHQCGPTMDMRDFITNELISDVEGHMAGGELKFTITWEQCASMTTNN